MHSRIFVVETDEQNRFDEDEIFEYISGENHADYVDEITDLDEFAEVIESWFPAILDVKATRTALGIGVSLSTAKALEWYAEKARNVGKLATELEQNPTNSMLMWEIEAVIDDRYGVYLYIPAGRTFDTLSSVLLDLTKTAQKKGQDEINLHISQAFDYHF